jgi:hypothetical protein
MKRRILATAFVAMMLCGVAAVATTSSASADTPVVSVTVGSPLTVANRLLVSVPVHVVCAPIGSPGDITLSDNVTVSVSQVDGKSVSSGTATISAGPFSPQNPTAPGFLTCDGSTVNTVIVPVQGNGPFHGGGAIVSASTSHSVGTCFFPGFCSTDAFESGSVGPTGVNFRGGGN